MEPGTIFFVGLAVLGVVLIKRQQAGTGQPPLAGQNAVTPDGNAPQPVPIVTDPTVTTPPWVAAADAAAGVGLGFMQPPNDPPAPQPGAHNWVPPPDGVNPNAPGTTITPPPPPPSSTPTAPSPTLVKAQTYVSRTVTAIKNSLS